MPDYILREAAIKQMQLAEERARKAHRGNARAAAQEAIWYINEIPAADVVPVVRCKDCEHWGHDHDAGRWCWCRSLDIGTAPEFYCKDGCRMDGGERHD